MLDTNAVIAMTKGHAGVRRRIQDQATREIAVPAIVAHELYYGFYKSYQRPAYLANIETLPFRIVDFDRDDAKAAAGLRAHLAAQGTPIGPYDVLIAGQALARGLILVTHNIREFQRVPGLVIEDWEA